MSPSNGCTNGGGRGVNNKNFIEHHVSKMDTLAGVAIKYGVEVADIKRLNGLATDLQMFALKTLLIPLPGRHPPSPVLCSSKKGSPAAPSGGNGIEKTTRHQCHSSLLESFESFRLKPPQEKVSSAMISLQSYYGLKTSSHKGAAEGNGMAVCRPETSDYLTEGLLPKASPNTVPPYHSYKTRNLSNGFLPENGAEADYVPLVEPGEGEVEKSSDKSIRRRQKAEADSRGGTPEKLLKEESNGGTSDFSPVTGKGLSMRAKSASKPSLTTESEQGWLNSMPIGLGDSLITNGLNGVHKSSSTPSLQDQDSNNSSVWPTPKWSLKPDLQSLSTAAISIPMFDGLPKPISGRRSKAALD